MKKFLLKLLTVIMILSCAIGLVACGEDEESEQPDSKFYSIYTTYVAYAESEGVTPLTYEEWLATVKGEKGDKGDAGAQGPQGEKGVGIADMKIEKGKLYVKYTNSNDYVEIGDLTFDLPGEENPQGLDFYHLDDGTYAVGGGKAILLSTITIPSTYKGCLVTSIVDFAFEHCSSLTNITIPNSVTSIGDEAFSVCSSLTNVTIPNSVTSIGSWVFSGCDNLTSLNYLGTKEEWDMIDKAENWDGGNSINISFANKLSLGYTLINESEYSVSGLGEYTDEAEIVIPAKYNGLPVTSIGNYAFCNCTSLTSVTIGNSVTRIGDGAFSGCNNLTSLNYLGTKSEWEAIVKDVYCWKYDSSIMSIICSDGTIDLTE